MSAGALVLNLPAFRVDKRHDRNGACALDRERQFPLMIGAIARDSSWHDFTAFSYKIIEDNRILVVNFNVGVRAETTEFSSVEKFSLVRTGWFLSGWCSHHHSPFVSVSCVWSVSGAGSPCFCCFAGAVFSSPAAA